MLVHALYSRRGGPWTTTLYALACSRAVHQCMYTRTLLFVSSGVLASSLPATVQARRIAATVSLAHIYNREPRNHGVVLEQLLVLVRCDVPLRNPCMVDRCCVQTLFTCVVVCIGRAPHRM